MNRFLSTRIILLIICLTPLGPYQLIARSRIGFVFRIDNIEYLRISDTEVEVYSGQYASGDVVIPQFVKIRKKNYKVVKIGEFAFDNNFRITSISIPNSVTQFGQRPFRNLSNLETVIVPDYVDLEFPNKSIFHKCNKLKSIRGNTISRPQWLLEHLNAQEEQQVLENSFEVYVEGRILELMDTWQQKKEYETTAQWQQRVTEDTRKKHLEIVEQQAIDEYVAMQGLNVIEGEIGYYDADYNIFPISTKSNLGTLGTFYLQVPIEEAPKFKENWNSVSIEPKYGIVNGDLALVSATCVLEGKSYHTVNIHDAKTLGAKVELPPLQYDIEENQSYDIDTDIPLANVRSQTTFAIIIGNENYKEVAKVPYALNDALIFATYCERTLGLPQKNVKIYKDATYGTMLSAIENIQEIAEAYEGEINVIFYYAGHGIPDETSKDAFLLPVDANGRNMAACYPIELLYKELNKLKAQQVTVFLDACFSGTLRGKGMLASARGVAIAAKETTPQGNMVVFSAASADETAYPLEETKHGLFTYYLLRKLNETKGDVTLGELGSYIREKVTQESVVTNGKIQTPTITPSESISAIWKEMKLISQ